MKALALSFLLASGLAAQTPAPDITGRWSGVADSTDEAGTTRHEKHTVEIRREEGKLVGNRIDNAGARGAALDVQQDGPKVNLYIYLDFEGGEPQRWKLELKDGKLTGTFSAQHHNPAKWIYDRVGTISMVKETAPPARRQAPTRDPNTTGYVSAKALPDGQIPSPKMDGNFIIGPTYQPAPEMAVRADVPHGEVFNFTMESTDSKFYPGIAREPRPAGQQGPPPAGAPRTIVTHPAPYTRKVAVYVPKQYVAGTATPFIIGADGPDLPLFQALDNLIAQHRVPAMVAISIGNGGGDGQGSERGLEYDTMSPLYAEFVEKEVLPLVEKQCGVKLTKDPDARATMGGSSGGSVALIMAWYHPELYHRVLTYSGTYVNQQWPSNPESPHGAWEFHEHLIPESAAKPIRLWMEVGDRDNLGGNDGYHDWVLANENMAKVLATKGYHYQFLFARNAGHVDRAVKQETLPEALEYIWQGYPVGGSGK